MTTTEQPVWNLYARFDQGGAVTGLLMPDETTLQLPPEPTGDGWHAVLWPVNPHFTGRRGIVEMLEQSYPTRRKA